MVKLCHSCGTARAVLRRPKTGSQLCRECFYAALEGEVHETVVANRLFKRGERVRRGKNPQQERAAGSSNVTVAAAAARL